MKRLFSLFPWAAFGYVVAIATGIHLWNARLGHPLPIEGTHQGARVVSDSYEHQYDPNIAWVSRPRSIPLDGGPILPGH
jgi:hypothetical protein